MSELFETERLSLRKVSLKDKGKLSPLLGQEELMKWFGGPLRGKQVTAWIDGNIRRYKADGYSYLVVEAKESKELFGLMGLLYEEIEGQTYLGIAYLVTPEKQGFGYAKEGIKALLDEGVQKGADMIVAQIAKENQASRSLVQSFGFTFKRAYKRPQQDKLTVYEIYQMESVQWEEQR